MSAVIKKGSLVVVISGKHAGKTGKVLEVDRRGGKVSVEGVALVSKHKKAGASQSSGIIRAEAMFSVSKVRLAE